MAPCSWRAVQARLVAVAQSSSPQLMLRALALCLCRAVLLPVRRLGRLSLRLVPLQVALLVLYLSSLAPVLRTRAARCPLPLVRAHRLLVGEWPSLLAQVAQAVLSASRRGVT